MHEMSLAMNIIEIALTQAQSEGATRINEVEVEVGDLAGVLTDSLAFCFEAARSGTLAQDADLKIVPIHGRGKCLDCNSEFDADSFFTLCPECESYKINILQGKDLTIRSINID